MHIFHFLFLIFYIFFFIFFISQVLIFRVVRGIKGQKMAQNDNKLCRTAYLRQETYIIWFSFLLHMCKSIISPIVIFIFLKFWFSGLLVGVCWLINLCTQLFDSVLPFEAFFITFVTLPMTKTCVDQSELVNVGVQID